MEISQSSHVPKDKTLTQCRESYKEFLQRSEIGFFKLPERRELWRAAEKFTEKISFFKNMVIVGLGGSSLGTRVIQEIAQTQNIFFVDNVDAIEFENLVAHLLKEESDFKKTCWAFVSKSGTTIESLCALEILQEIYQEKNLQLANYSIVISETKE
ncbi:MAG: glucose-6-phosphate isomerase, partial [Pseudobdellovibrionaceae bacterium]